MSSFWALHLARNSKKFSIWHLAIKTSSLEASSHQLIQSSKLQAINLSLFYTVDFTLKLLLHCN